MSEGPDLRSNPSPPRFDVSAFLASPSAYRGFVGFVAIPAITQDAPQLIQWRRANSRETAKRRATAHWRTELPLTVAERMLASGSFNLLLGIRRQWQARGEPIGRIVPVGMWGLVTPENIDPWGYRDLLPRLYPPDDYSTSNGLVLVKVNLDPTDRTPWTSFLSGLGSDIVVRASQQAYAQGKDYLLLDVSGDNRSLRNQWNALGFEWVRTIRARSSFEQGRTHAAFTVMAQKTVFSSHANTSIVSLSEETAIEWRKRIRETVPLSEEVWQGNPLGLVPGAEGFVSALLPSPWRYSDPIGAGDLVVGPERIDPDLFRRIVRAAFGLYRPDRLGLSPAPAYDRFVHLCLARPELLADELSRPEQEALLRFLITVDRSLGDEVRRSNSQLAEVFSRYPPGLGGVSLNIPKTVAGPSEDSILAKTASSTDVSSSLRVSKRERMLLIELLEAHGFELSDPISDEFAYFVKNRETGANQTAETHFVLWLVNDRSRNQDLIQHFQELVRTSTKWQQLQTKSGVRLLVLVQKPPQQTRDIRFFSSVNPLFSQIGLPPPEVIEDFDDLRRVAIYYELEGHGRCIEFALSTLDREPPVDAYAGKQPVYVLARLETGTGFGYHSEQLEQLHMLWPLTYARFARFRNQLGQNFAVFYITPAYTDSIFRSEWLDRFSESVALLHREHGLMPVFIYSNHKDGREERLRVERALWRTLTEKGLNDRDVRLVTSYDELRWQMSHLSFIDRSQQYKPIPRDGWGNQQLEISTTKGSGKLPLFASNDLGRPTPGIKRVLVMMPGADRDAEHVTKVGKAVLERAGDDTVMLVPHFLTDLDVGATGSSPSELLHWSMEGVQIGKTAIGPAPISQVSALDALIEQLPGLFPDLQEVKIVGGSFAHRHAVFGQDHPLLAERGIGIHHIVVNAASYFYFKSKPPLPFRFKHRRTVKEWPYGSHRAPAGDAKREQPEKLLQRYLAREVTYLSSTESLQSSTVSERLAFYSHDDLVGAEENQQTPKLVVHPAVQAQGNNGPMRTKLFFGYLVALAGRHVHQCYLVPGADAELEAILTSPEGLFALLRQGNPNQLHTFDRQQALDYLDRLAPSRRYDREFRETRPRRQSPLEARPEKSGIARSVRNGLALPRLRKQQTDQHESPRRGKRPRPG